MRRSLRTMAVVLAILGAVGRSPADGPPQEGGPPANMPPPEVTFVTVEPKTIDVEYEHLALAEPSRTTEVRARVRGFLSSRTFDEGATVKAGDVLFEINSDEFRANVEIAKAQVAQAEAQLRLAEKELDRLKRIRESAAGAVSQGDVDRAEAQVDVAKAGVVLMEAGLAKAKLDLSYTTVHAPANGVIWKALKDDGALVDSGENSLLTRITQLDPIYVSFSVSEREYVAWRRGVASGRYVMPDEKGDFQAMLSDGTVVLEGGKINFAEPAFDERTGTTRIRIEFPNPDLKLRPGQFVRVRALGVTRPNVTSVPQRSVLQSPAGSSVFVIDEKNTVQFRPVKVGAWNGTEWNIEDGLAPGERVLVDGFMKAPPGTVVTPVPYIATPAATEVAGKRP